MLAGLMAIAAAGSAIAGRMQDVLRTAIVQSATPEIVGAAGIGTLLMDALKSTGLAIAPVAGACLAAGRWPASSRSASSRRSRPPRPTPSA
jgi:hypothetical protein